jgi:hypothetical protein
VSLPTKNEDGQCKSYARIALHIDLAPTGLLSIQRREQFEDKDDANRDFNDMGGYELCHGKELTPPTSTAHCSVGNRMTAEGPCLTRLEQLTYDEAHSACKERGGQLAKVSTIKAAEALRDFGDNKHLGIGLRDYGADDDWRFDDGSAANDDVDSMEQAFAKSGRRRAANEFRRSACVFVASKRSRGTPLRHMDCATKTDWVCEGTMENRADGIVARGDLMADEGAFCLFHAHEPIDLLPNDEGKNFRNTDLQCHLQASSRNRRQCAFDPKTNKLITKRGDRLNGLNYPVKGSTIGWTDKKENTTFLQLENADDDFHCHYSPNNNGLLRVYAMQHMFDRNYIGSMRRTCGCGYRHLAQLVSRCDCTRSGARDNNCAKWHRTQLIRATNETNPVRCNNCNANNNL